MQKEKVIEIFKSGHNEFQHLTKLLTPNQITNTQILEDWTVKDIMAHLSAWNWEQAKEIDNILHDKPTWNNLYNTRANEDNFNKKAVEERKDKDLLTIIEEWENSFETLIKRIEKLTEEEWNHECKGQIWRDGKPATMYSLFRYEEDGQSDEAHHAQQVKKFFNL